MHFRKQLMLMVGALILACTVAAQSVPKESYDFNFLGAPLSDPVLQHSKETYVLFGCAYCHGLNLESRGEATDLMHSKLVGRDTDGKVIAALLRTGIPQTAKLSPMPQFSDLSDQQLDAIARWIHYARAEGRFKELTEAKDPPVSDAMSGKALFDDRCGSCHSASGDLAGIAKKYGSAALKAAFLKPKIMDEVPSSKLDQLHEERRQAGRLRHRILLENYSAEEASNLAAYLAILK